MAEAEKARVAVSSRMLASAAAAGLRTTPARATPTAVVFCRGKRGWGWGAGSGWGRAVVRVRRERMKGDRGGSMVALDLVKVEGLEVDDCRMDAGLTSRRWKE